ncbi:hypothetical protein HU200_057645 [Digitaria exilis]|uniref:Uncharacterized protein n=1 Tax=Digitaria exilis TaxID=1010633 RepID=A0A835AH05_9POAL|nr:hypothetical protein HU200_057645 [Digitaria exilis]CAB3477210.1 unnamed protein product [Digitaria exilis]
MPKPALFTITILSDEKKKPAAATARQPSATSLATPPPLPVVRRRRHGVSRVLQLLINHSPAEVVERAALAAIHQAYTSLLEIAPPEGAQRVLEASAPIDPADPYSPLLHVEASLTHCHVTVPIPTTTGGDRAHPPEQQQVIKNHHPGLTRASVRVSPGKLHLARLAGGEGRRRSVTWSYVEARPDASSEALLGVVRGVRSCMNEAIARETTLLEMVRASGFGKSPKAAGIVAARAALEEMRAVLDVDAILQQRRRCQKRGRSSRETSSCRAAAEMEGVEMLIDGMRALHVDEVDDDADVLTKRMRTLRV